MYLNSSLKVWRVKFSLAKIRAASRDLLTLEEKDPRRLFEGNALLRRLVRRWRGRLLSAADEIDNQQKEYEPDPVHDSHSPYRIS